MRPPSSFETHRFRAAPQDEAEQRHAVERLSDLLQNDLKLVFVGTAAGPRSDDGCGHSMRNLPATEGWP